MSTNRKISQGEIILIIIGALIGIYILVQLILLVVKLAAFYGYNFFFLVDNLIRIDAFNPVVTWGILGLFTGSVIGVIVAVKKKKLPKWLILCPLLLTALLITVMSMINKPAQYPSDFDLARINPPTPVIEVTRAYYTATSDVNVRDGFSKSGRRIFTLKKGQEVAVLQKGFYDSHNIEWAKIKYNGQEGFVNLQYLMYSRTTKE